MSQTLIRCALIVIISCTQWQSVHMRKDEKENADSDPLSPRRFFASNIAVLENLRRPILISYDKLDLDGETSCTAADKSTTISHEGFGMQCNGWLDGCIDLDEKADGYETPTGEYCTAKAVNPTGPVEYGLREKCGGNPISKILNAKHKKFHTCMCECTDDSAYYELNVNWGISLEPSVADLNSDKIVEGVRIRTNHKIIYLEIKEKTNGCSEDGVWKSPSRTDKLIRNEHYSPLIPGDSNLQLNEVEVPLGYVVTGVRFRKILTPVGKGKGIIRLEARGTKVDEETGGLISSSSVWFDTEGLPRTETLDGRVAIPVDGGRNLKQNITFKTRQNKHRNLGLLTVPYLDLSDVAEGKALKGVGLVCRNCDTDEEYLIPTISSALVEKSKNTSRQVGFRVPINNFQYIRVSAGAQNSPGFIVAFVSMVTFIIFYEIQRI